MPYHALMFSFFPCFRRWQSHFLCASVMSRATGVRPVDTRCLPGVGFAPALGVPSPRRIWPCRQLIDHVWKGLFAQRDHAVSTLSVIF